MKLSKTSEYTLRILSFMVNSDLQVFSAKYLIDSLDIPGKYLRHLMTKMSKKGFIKSIQGREGGYVFAKNASKIYLSDVIDSVEGMDKYNGCLMGFENCSDENPCGLHNLYSPVRQNIVDFLSSTKIQDLKNINIQKF